MNPSCSHFKSALKTLLVNNFMSRHSAGANCEEDESEGALNSLKPFLIAPDKPVEKEEYVVDTHFLERVEDELFVFKNYGKRAIHLHAYLSGYVAKRLLKIIGVCKICRRELITPTSTNAHDYVECRAYGPKALVRAETNYINIFSKAFLSCSTTCQRSAPKIILSQN